MRINSLIQRIAPGYEKELEEAVRNCTSLLDLGCGSSSPIQSFSKKLYCVGVDTHGPSIELSKKSQIHNKYYRMDVLEIGKNFKPDSFDCVLASDLIEHLDRDEGIKLMEMMETIAKHKIIIFTPNGFQPQEPHHDNPWQLHKSGWTVKEMRNRNYNVIGINGWKPLRKEFAEIRFQPYGLWKPISDFSQLFVRNIPAKAFQILCVKIKKNIV
jgi:SAM-dependent methyltransferase